ncbi:MAG TPA: helix-turn-helix domain-containing protein [Actinomycetota bacterium]|jgi:DNA-binding transcriptional ArsR family regulator|nr:helix-turn-helix domain-containing protein [Actinomycetota bacterium]
MSGEAGSRRQRDELPQQLVIKDVATLKALAHPLRLQVLFELGVGPTTVKAVASTLGVAATRLYYHFKILEQAGLIRVADRRLVSGIEERRYQAVAHSYGPAPELAPSLVEGGVVGALLRVVRAELELALMARSPAPPGEPAATVPVLSFTGLALSLADVKEVQQRLAALTEEFSSDQRARGTRMYHALLVGYLAPHELRSH